MRKSIPLVLLKIGRETLFLFFGSLETAAADRHLYFQQTFSSREM